MDESSTHNGHATGEPVSPAAAPASSPSAGRPGTACALPIKAGAQGGGQPGNSNRLRHGLKARFPLGVLPKGFARIERNVGAFRRGLEEQVLAIHGEIDLINAAVINTACRWERHSQMCLRWLKVGCEAVAESERLSADQRLNFSRDIARASAERDKCLKSLGLSVTILRDLWDTLDATATATRDDGEQGDPTADPARTTAADGQPGSEAGTVEPPTPGASDGR